MRTESNAKVVINSSPAVVSAQFDNMEAFGKSLNVLQVEVMGFAETGNPALDQAIQNWLEWDQNERTSVEIQDLVEAKDYQTLTRLLLRRMDFGTAGLRGRMGAGFAQMNDLVVIQTAQGLLAYLLDSFTDTKEHGIVVGYDGRYHSKRFAEITAAVFAAASVPVRLYSAVCPTPFVPFGLTHYGCVAGVMVTASHNPKQDNGYKVYWRNGAQVSKDSRRSDCVLSREIVDYFPCG